ncbi:DUF6458 family protein [Terracoccus luteus]|uniref:Heme O synthase-like polyprenyltransferase n=1 Tax=Terracoccus luteus TaxID=53356 RepID=A0A495XVN7_9MICO|nr:DUF6458 family protein [Terracoccus luteus]MBB2985564.1 heme O synthase-like polyprenyltransferase [Terracoccus luteus]MCP2171216.1 heme O synthase-like polyprenyltransferase [Terracoccus luteus]RKT78317.1 hypothetical protein DFJ68_1760 [Terracoccus luteus]
MGIGVLLAVIGAILTFAVSADPPGISLPTVGVILMVAGAGLILNAKRTTHSERTVTRIEDPGGQRPVVRKTVEERDTRH